MKATIRSVWTLPGDMAMTYGRDPAQKTLRLKRVFRPMQHVYRAMLDPMIDLAAVIQDAEERARHDLVDFVQIRLIVHTAQHGDEGKGTSQDRIEVTLGRNGVEEIEFMYNVYFIS